VTIASPCQYNIQRSECFTFSQFPEIYKVNNKNIRQEVSRALVFVRGVFIQSQSSIYFIQFGVVH